MGERLGGCLLHVLDFDCLFSLVQSTFPSLAGDVSRSNPVVLLVCWSLHFYVSGVLVRSSPRHCCHPLTSSPQLINHV